MSNDVQKPCCDELVKAQRAGTDNEGYGALVTAPDAVYWPEAWAMGSDLQPMRFCPWCGHRLDASEDTVEGTNDD